MGQVCATPICQREIEKSQHGFNSAKKKARKTLGSTQINQRIGFKQQVYAYEYPQEVIEITVLLKQDIDTEDYNVGIRTVENSAVSPEDFEGDDQIICFKEGSKVNDTWTFSIKINFDNETDTERQQNGKASKEDKHFHVELYDPGTMDCPKLFGDDTDTKVIIVDGSATKYFQDSMTGAVTNASSMAENMKSSANEQVKEAKRKSLIQAQDLQNQAAIKAEIIKKEAAAKTEELKKEAALKGEQLKQEALEKQAEIKKQAEEKAKEYKEQAEAMKADLEKQAEALQEMASPEAIYAAAEEAAKKLLTEEQQEQLERVKAFKSDPENALYSEVERMLDEEQKKTFSKLKELVHNPDAFEALELAAQQLPEDSSERILYERAKKLKVDPKQALILEAELVMTEDQKDKFEIVKKIAFCDGDYIQFVPEEYKQYYSLAEKALAKAKELKKKKDELQLKLIKKAVEPIWKIKDKENLGFITKDQCCEIAYDALKAIGQEKYFDLDNFTKAFEIIILAGDVASGVVSLDDIKHDLTEKSKEIQEHATSQLKEKATELATQQIDELKHVALDKANQLKDEIVDDLKEQANDQLQQLGVDPKKSIDQISALGIEVPQSIKQSIDDPESQAQDVAEFDEAFKNFHIDYRGSTHKKQDISDLEDFDLQQRAEDLQDNLKNEAEKQAKETLNQAADEARELLGKYSSGQVKKEQLIELINYILSKAVPI